MTKANLSIGIGDEQTGNESQITSAEHKVFHLPAGSQVGSEQIHSEVPASAKQKVFHLSEGMEVGSEQIRGS